MWVLCAYILAGCQSHTASHDEHDHEAHEHEAGHVHDHEHEHEHTADEHTGETHAGEIAFKKAQAEAVGLQTRKVTPGAFTNVIKASGRVLAAQGEESTIVATVPGVVVFGKLPEGTAVRKGQPILNLASSNLSEGNVAIRTQSAYEKAKKEYERMQSLIGDKIVSAKDFEQARLNYENAKTAWEAVKGKQTSDGVSVVAPQNGYLKNLLVKEGDYVSVGQPLATVTQNNRLMLRAEVSEKYYQSLPVIRSANFRTPYDDQTYQLSELHGRLLSYGKSSDANAFYIPVTFEFDNKGAIIPGSFVEIYLLTAPMENVISVPASALIEEQGIYSVFVKEHEEAYRKVSVTLGADNGKEVQILSGLKAGDEVVTEGAYQIKLASASNAIPAHTHNH